LTCPPILPTFQPTPVNDFSPLFCLVDELPRLPEHHNRRAQLDAQPNSWDRMRIPAKANADSERNANGIPGRRRTVSERSDAGISIVQEVFVFGQEKPIRSAAQDAPASGERGAGYRGGSPFPCPALERPRRALARRLRGAAFFTHRVTTHFDAMGVVNRRPFIRLSRRWLGWRT